MGAPTLTDLATLVAAGHLEQWLAQIPDDAARSRLRRAIEIDRRLWTQYPQSMASCLLARTRGARELEGLHAAWRRELDERGAPWVDALRPLPVPAGLLAEHHGGDGLALKSYHRAAFETEDVVILRGIQELTLTRWSWRQGEIAIERDAELRELVPRDRFPRFERDEWGPTFLVRSPGAPRIALPCPDEGSAHATLAADGDHAIVYGSHEDYGGGFVYLVDLATLAIERSLETARPVSGVHACLGRDRWLVETYGGLVAWVDGRATELPIPRQLAQSAALSPSGAHLATSGDGLRIWSLDELLASGARPSRPGFSAAFDPTGERLLAGTEIFDGMSGHRLAELDPEFGQYLEGGPAQPWMWFGTLHLISLHGSLQLWDTRTAAPVSSANGFDYPQWFAVAYDRAGARLAALHRGHDTVCVHELPSGQEHQITFGLCGAALAMSPDGRWIAVRQGGAVEVRSVDGEVRLRAGELAPGEPDEWWRRYSEAATLRFSTDGGRIARFLSGDGWRIWSLDGDQIAHLREREAIDEVDGFAPPAPRDWTIEPGTLTVFVHRPTGTRIAIPAADPWICNPADPQIVASDGAHLQLRAAIRR